MSFNRTNLKRLIENLTNERIYRDKGIHSKCKKKKKKTFYKENFKFFIEMYKPLFVKTDPEILDHFILFEEKDSKKLNHIACDFCLKNWKKKLMDLNLK